MWIIRNQYSNICSFLFNFQTILLCLQKSHEMILFCKCKCMHMIVFCKYRCQSPVHFIKKYLFQFFNRFFFTLNFRTNRTYFLLFLFISNTEWKLLFLAFSHPDFNSLCFKANFLPFFSLPQSCSSYFFSFYIFFHSLFTVDT